MKQIPITFPYYGVVGNIALFESDTKGRPCDRLVLLSSSTTDEGIYTPAESFTLTQSKALIALRDALLLAYPLEAEQSKADLSMALSELSVRRKQTLLDQADLKRWQEMYYDLQKSQAQAKTTMQDVKLDAVGEVQHLHELNDEWIKHLPIGTKLYSEKDVNDWMNAQVAAQTMEASCLNNVIVSLEAEIATIKAATPEQSYGWLIACDEELVCAHLGVAELSHSYAYAKAKLMELIDWHIAVATDPAVNGGLSLQPKAPEPVNQMLLELIQQSTAYVAICEVLEHLGLGSFSRAPSEPQIIETCDLLRSLISAPQPTELTDEDLDAIQRLPKVRGALLNYVHNTDDESAVNLVRVVLAAQKGPK